MSARYVMHDGYRWRVLQSITIDDEPGYELSRRVPVRKALGGGIIERTVKSIRIDARVRDCDPDQHDPVRVWRNGDAVLRYYPKTGVIKISLPRGRTKFETTLKGVFQMAARADANRKALERAHRRRTRRRS